MDQEYNFKKFTKVGSKSGNYSISINSKSFSFGFNSGFYSKENINKYKKVVLFFDEQKKAIAFNFTNDEKAEGAFTVVHGNNQSTGSVSTKSFFVNNKLNTAGHSGKRKPKKINSNNFGLLFVIELDEMNKII